jgi:alanyl-tRNA synthetase
MTQRLYYPDSYLKEFSATVLEQRTAKTGPAVVLDQTAFYPDSGGQPCDTGALNDALVWSVTEEGNVILHLLDREIAGNKVFGRIDWNRRFDNMQQHTGQHILSQAFLSVAKAQTLSFHIGTELSTIDIDLAQPSPALMEEVQSVASGIVFEDREVHILTTTQNDLGALGVRKGSQREGEIRVIDVDRFDRSPCGGTHVKRTGEIGLIFVSGFERYKGGTRVEFVAGRRALSLLGRDHELLKRLARIQSSTLDGLPETSEKLLQERMALQRENALMQEQLLQAEARDLLLNAEKTDRGRMVSRVFENRKLETLKLLAQKLTADQGVVAILGIAGACQIVISRSSDVQGNCGEAVKKIAAELGGRGGGRPESAQAGGFSADSLDLWMSAMRRYFAG